ncbi:MAG: 16S rRNA (cytosine(967)-C(5))-methyltransferase, partial [uncultured Actinomycetospora sp.]
VVLPEEAYDRVLVDAPCTGLGALRRRPQALERRAAADVEQLAELQRSLLRVGRERARPGGVVTYATCSPHPDETTAVVADVAAEAEAEVLDTVALLPGVPDTAAHDGPGVQLWPHRHGTDAMYAAVLRKA